MTKPDVKIGEQVFQPKQLGIIEGFKTNIRFGIGHILLDMCLPYEPQYQQLMEEFHLRVYYGDEAAEAFDKFITPHVRSTLEIQMSKRRSWRDPAPLRVPAALDFGPVLDKPTGKYLFTKTPAAS